MSKQAVSYELTLTDKIEDKSVFFADLIGEMTRSPLSYSYRENNENASVEIKIVDGWVRLIRKAEANTEINFDEKQVTEFHIVNDQTQLMGQVETLNLVNLPQYLFIHYRLWVNDAIIAEQEMELKVKVSEA